MSSEDLRTQCFQVFTRIQELHKQASVQLEENKEVLDLEAIKFNLDQDPRPMIAVDGSFRKLWHDIKTQSEIFLFRAAGMNYCTKDNQRLILQDVEVMDQIVLITNEQGVEVPDSDPETDLNIALINFSGKGPREQTLLYSGFQHYFELTLALKMANKNREHIIALDGTLSVLRVDPLEDLLHKLATLVDQKNHWLVGISKTNRTRTFNRLLTDEQTISQFVGKADCCYVPWTPPRIDWIESIGDSYFVHLHPQALKWFRADLYSVTPEELFPSLATYAKDLRMPGYPAPLTEAHQICKIIRNLDVIPDQLIFDTGIEANLPIEQLMAGLTDHYARVQGGIHERLDLMTK